MRDVLLRGKSHYRDFLASEEGIATNILADRLAGPAWRRRSATWAAWRRSCVL
jgi:hypothetical protein